MPRFHGSVRPGLRGTCLLLAPAVAACAGAPVGAPLGVPAGPGVPVVAAPAPEAHLDGGTVTIAVAWPKRQLQAIPAEAVSITGRGAGQRGP